MNLPRPVRIVELASVLAGPSVGMFFAELGAEVIKVENPQGGDVTRSWKLGTEAADNDRPAYFCAVNWGKRSICLDLRKPGDLEKLLGLLSTTDVLLTSFKPGDAEKFGLSWEHLHARFPALIVGEISGYGPQDARVGYDAIIQAEAGFTALNGVPGQTFKMPVALVDVLAAHQLKEGLLLALWQQNTDGMGRRIHVSLIQAALAALVNQGTNYLVAGQIPGPMGNEHPNIVPYGRPFVCADGRALVLAVGTDKQFSVLCAILGIPELASNVKAQTNASRVQHRAWINEQLEQVFWSFHSEELIRHFEAASIPFGRMNLLTEVAALPAAEKLEMKAAGLRSWRSAVFVTEARKLSPPPHLGEHQSELDGLIALK